MELTDLSSKSGRAIATLLNLYVSCGSTARFKETAKIYLFIMQISHCCLQQ